MKMEAADKENEVNLESMEFQSNDNKPNEVNLESMEFQSADDKLNESNNT
eukprot:CAMPEP_0176358408 /NCGR_PEP_ID=MMETSP0126-20121128/15531_1 /TAXON_ID=141414 ORGANISM="Strombidinopsis acuminatum, Strain SPMC142" /NCGR_SAMPLE_ID=MMETSP0126 /ASSEMBLY_ACC=CAM_ASM_000229 /LENGTH=49 /DNA_ID=CAMNT_0017712561 /DNA_START=1851 /DNA_END=2000 /DNA_ORIENTATION=+